MKTISLEKSNKMFSFKRFSSFSPMISILLHCTGAKNHDSSKAKTKQMYFKELSVSRIFHVVNLWTSAISSCKALHDTEAEQTKVLISPKTSRAPIDEGHRARLTTFSRTCQTLFVEFRRTFLCLFDAF